MKSPFKIGQALVVRVALLPIIWGLVLAGWFSLGKTLLEQALPDMKASAVQAAGQNAQRLDALAQPLDSLASDPRLDAGDDEAAALKRRRALYEFGYLNPTGVAYVLTPEGRVIGRPAGAPDVELNAAALAPTESAGIDARPMGDALLLMKKHAQNPVVVALRVPLKALMGETEKADNKTETQLLFDGQGQWLKVNLKTGLAKSTSAPDLQVLSWAGSLNQTITVAEQVPGWPGWWVSRAAGVSELNRTVFLLQLLLLAAGVGVSVALWLVPAHWFSGGSATKRVKPKKTAVRGVNKDDGYIGSTGSIGGMAGGRRGLAPGLDELLGPQGVRAPTGQPNKKEEPPEIKTPQQILKQVEEKKQRKAVKDNDILIKLQRALRNNGDNETLSGVYQPIFRSSDGVPTMHEVLVRLIEPNGDVLLPGTFLPVAKQHNLLPQLDAALLNLMMREHFRLGQQPPTKLALNISSTTFAGMTYMRTMMEKIPPSMVNNIVFEIRSRELLADPSALEFLRELKDIGAELAVDYFGGGTAMLETSKRMGFDYVKLDASLLWENMDQRRDLLGLAKVSRSLGLPMVLEKVETQAVEVFARRVGIPFLQGYHFAKPAETLEVTPLRGWREAARQPNAPVEAAS